LYTYTGRCVQLAANHLCDEYVECRFNFKTDDWPPFHPKHYTTLALIHHRGRHTDTKVISVTQELVTEGNIANLSTPQLSSNINYHRKNISELFAPDAMSSVAPNFILIEGAPGIGKIVLSKEIAYHWAQNKLIKSNKTRFLNLFT